MEFQVQLEKGIDDLKVVGLPVNVSDLKVGVVKSYSKDTGIAIVEITDEKTIQKIMKPMTPNFRKGPIC